MLVKDELLDRVVARVREQLAEDQVPQVEEFVRQYYAWITAEDLADRSPIDLYGAAVGHWTFARQRTPGEPKVRVYNPQFDEHGWQSTHTVIEIVTDDMPFLVDSTRMAINREGYAIHLMLHPIMKVRRDGAGMFVEVLEPGSDDEEGVLYESIILLEIDRQTDPGVLKALHDCITTVLRQVRAAVEDWPDMRERVHEIVSEIDENLPPVEDEDPEEARAYLEWIADDNFTFLGYREYDLHTEDGKDLLRSVPGTGLGILRETDQKPHSLSFAKLPPEVRRLAHAANLLNLTKANSRSTVHRPSYLDYVGVKRFDAEGEATGERRFLGLYAFSAYSVSAFEIPIVRRKVGYVLERAGFPEGSHNEKDLLEILETYPRDELFQIEKEELFEIAMGILHLQERQRVRLFVRRDAYGRFFSCLVFVPRDRYNTRIREKMQEILQRAFDGTNVEFNVRLSESVLARLHFIVYVAPGENPDYDASAIEERLAEATRSWTDNLYEALIEHFGEERGIELFHKYRDAFPPGYRDGFLPRTAVADIARIEELESEEDIEMSLYHPLEEPENFLGFKLFRLGEQTSLSGILPLLEDMGVEVVDERPHKVEPAGSRSVWIYDFGLLQEADGELQTGEVREIFQDAFARAWRGTVENDGFNRLVLRARLTWRQVTVLRAYCKYLRQAGTTFSQNYMEDALFANLHIARLLVELFEARFDPSRQARAEAETERLRGEIEEALDEVVSLDEDRILRNFLNVTLATVRTNYYQRTPEGEPKPYLSFKFDPSEILVLPLPRPRFEIFVYSPRMEGVHLRGGRVARGGIRWSDRREDFRTEVLGLMKAQMVKNAVIVPTGAKGGFVVKRQPAEPEALRTEVVECYRAFVNGLLDLTDDLVSTHVVHPPDTVIHDGDDTYLVVAADKGTATFSDIANAVSAEYGFWLGDAFASGGSAGYDHKAMGITARGAWESVKRHFRELGVDTQTQDFTVVGVGDMSGDVFGNGMLLSEHIRLVAAFDHRHVFVDPTPDAATSFAERRRLFDLPRSSWADYDPALISPGGGVWPRTAKAIPVSEPMRAALGLPGDVDTLSPVELIRAVLLAPVDLLFNGGIGTYVKASTESALDVGDKANDAVRVDGRDLRGRVVGEGGNLGLTQRGRVEYALGGGRVNTDAIDNSAGVDTSDHEVNIKIALDRVVEAGELDAGGRAALLGEMTDEVAAAVLTDNHAQNATLAVEVASARSLLDAHARFLRALERSGRLLRSVEFLPDDRQLAERRRDGHGLTGPELSVLLAYAKLETGDTVLASALPDDPALEELLVDYFPAELRRRFPAAVSGHPLRREIVATGLTNRAVNVAGVTGLFRLAEETGVPLVGVVRAHAVARAVFEVDRLWDAVRPLDNRVSATTQVELRTEATRLAERATRWLLGLAELAAEEAAPLGALTDRFATPVAAVRAGLPSWLLGAEAAAFAERTDRLRRAGGPQAPAAAGAPAPPLPAP